ncbi:bifunctional proline dehydrogenase/L-glutamate gamma-semialdehyde dehydrogenase PutA [Leisingera daeponensis]|uniref:bifunctional proline dehydrogenase/L-glutamate gamma-semialdehyde dehydrogenase PutA n=1 Tax=Leisingera daeponensis TaxID=405746 RepID=UPI001C989BB6|nr:bifunctional proline dehydrogenase/L-glutamate gamma-semialdehyde dehydrogenase PutA [Leisingera daeponensis]MBY6055643.1 bifunctional proline dehydrogenase/L-glutamate gamma-semialdehyde dehydrogenase PutA [Leisingera daeponensis]
MTAQTKLRYRIDAGTYADQTAMRDQLVAQAALTDADREKICANAAALVRDIRGHSAPGLMEVFLAEYGLSTDEGVALMCLAEALLRVPDADTIDALIEDKIAPSDWGKHLGKSTSSLVNASTWALMLTGKVLDEERSPIGALRGAIKRLGEPVIRTAVSRAMKEMGRQFVLGETIESAMNRAAGMEAKGYTYSYDMLGEAARTEADASRYHLAYSKAISAIAAACHSDDIRKNPGISVKLSALHPRYELAHEHSVMESLVPRLKALALLAKAAKMGLNVDAEEADRLSLSLEVIEAVVSDPALAGWDGFGVVVQAYGPRTGLAIDALHEMAEKYDRRFMVRLVKGAYWDTEIKRAQVEGVDGFPVYTSKPLTDVSYISNARKLLGMTDRIYPQFATHNAHTVAAILHMAAGKDKAAYEFQRLHGMGETLHQMVLEQNRTNCRIYAPVGAHRDLLAYLVRRLLENGANSSFVNQIVDENVPPEVVAADPFAAVADVTRKIPTGPELYAPERPNSKGFDLGHAPTLARIEEARAPWRGHQWQAAPLLAGDAQPEAAKDVTSPTDQSVVGTVSQCSPEDIELALALADPWDAPAAERAAILNKAADLYEENFGELFAILAREAGKTIPDAVAELREAVDFLRYYAARIPSDPPAGIFSCISPWNFPLAIFTGQVSAALAAGNAVLAKPADQTPLIAHRAVQLMHEAGVPRSAMQLVPGRGSVVGAAITSDPRVNGVAFTGSTATALRIRKAMAENLQPGAPLIAETGGLNAMIVDSTALPEQAVQAVIESAFQSAGQRCSALRCLYLQDDIADNVLKMLKGAMDCLNLDDPWHLSTDSGPVIDEGARAGILAHIDKARSEGRVLKEMRAPQGGTFVAPTMIEVPGISALEEEIFGPVLHVARFKSQDLDKVISDINATGYGLTFGLHTRIDDRVQHVCDRVHAGNIYVNRNQIGAIVGSQPFGGEGLSGTGPKAGGPFYLSRFCAPDRQSSSGSWEASITELKAPSGVPSGPVTTSLPGPTGESNRLTVSARPPLLCMGPGPEAAAAQAREVISLGGTAIEAHGLLDLRQLETIQGIGGVLWWGGEATGREIEQSLAKRDGAIVPLIPGKPDRARVLAERHVCVDTTASGGNAQLLGGMA